MTDLMTHLHERYKELLAKQGNDIIDDAHEVLPDIDEFISFSRNYLANENQPLGLTYVAEGIGLKLADGTTITFRTFTAPAKGSIECGIPITRPTSMYPGMMADTSIPIT